MTIKERIKSLPDVVDYLKELPFYDKQIEKPKVKRLKNIDLLPSFLWRIECAKNRSCV